MRIEKRSMNWLPKPSLYNEQAAKRAKQKAAHQEFIANQSALSSTIGGIMTNNAQETTNIVSDIALKRMGYSKTS
jgi:hypothetical protein